MPRLSGKAGQRAFLAAFAECGQITKAAKAANVNRRAHYDWVATDPKYPARFAEACAQSGDALEDEATRRAMDGVMQVEWYQGRAVGTKRVYSDGMLMFLLRGQKPDKYREQLAVTGAGGKALMPATLTIEFVQPGDPAAAKEKTS